MADFRFGTHADHGNFEIRNVKIHIVGSLPAAQAGWAGKVVSLNGRLYMCDGAGWGLYATDSAWLNGQPASYYLDRTNHTGTQPVSSVTGVQALVNATPLSNHAAATGDVNFGNQKGINVLPGVLDSDIATYGQVRAVVQATDYKASVRYASSTNVAIVGLVQVDGITVSANDRVLLTGQTDPIQNGLWLTAAGAWTRPSDADGVGDVSGGTIVPVEDGNTNADTMWMCTVTGNVTPGTTPQTWIKYGASIGEIGIAGDGLQKAGSTYSVKLDNTGGAGTAGILAGPNGIKLDPASALRKAVGAVPAGSTTAVIGHALNTTDVTVQIRELSSGDLVFCGVTVVDAATVNVTFAVAPTALQYRYVIQG